MQGPFFGQRPTAVVRTGARVATDPGLALTLYETFVAGCTEKPDEVDDSSGEFGSFVVSLVGGKRGCASRKMFPQPGKSIQPPTDWS